MVGPVRSLAKPVILVHAQRRAGCVPVREKRDNLTFHQAPEVHWSGHSIVDRDLASSILVWGAKEIDMHLLRDMVRDQKFWAGLFVTLVFVAPAALAVLQK